ncbi:LysR substrate-binding domain-containing protein [Myxococcus sp. Y35]|uniref:LysR substrate-binding domain-containing protein n=1 Tax=Pseudomyxococcus flavus TaxID=3115648 RepID=UPI003CF84B9C
MRDLPLNALRAFALVYAHGGVRPAARELGIAHSSLSRHLAELEAWVGVPLTQGAGGRRGLSFTPQGETLGRTALAGLRDIAQAADAVREARSPHSVVVSTTASFAARWLLPRLPRLEAQHPRLEVSVSVDPRPVDLEAGGVDLALRMGRGPWRDVDCEPLLDEVLYPVMSPTYWRDAGRPERPAALTRLRLLHDRDSSASWELWRRAHGPAGLDVRKGPRLASSDLVLRAAVQGQGVTLARHRLAVDDLASGALLRPFAGLHVALGPAYWVVLSPNARSRPATAAVLAWLKAEAAACGPAA